MKNEFIEAVWSGNLEKVKSLIDEGVDINTRDSETGLTGAHIAAGSNCIEIFKIIVSHPKADLHLTDKWNRRPIDLASKLKYNRIIDLILYNKID